MLIFAANIKILMTNKSAKLTYDEVSNLYDRPLLELVFEAAFTHKKHHSSYEVKASRLISVKTGNCKEDCAYCAQSIRYNSNQSTIKMLTKNEVEFLALKAREEGLKRVCLSASFTKLPQGENFDNILEIIRTMKSFGMDVCLTMGKVNREQAKALSEAGIKAYNHNIDTSESFYPNIITSRTFQERIDTLKILSENGVNVCSGGIIGMGENSNDRKQMLFALYTLEKQPFTIPLNMLVPVKGTPMENMPGIDHFEMLRLIAVARILFPETNICLAAGRMSMPEGLQALCFLAGVNAVFTGEKLLTTPNANPDDDLKMFNKLGIKLI